MSRITEEQFHSLWSAGVGLPGYNRDFFLRLLDKLNRESLFTNPLYEPTIQWINSKDKKPAIEYEPDVIMRCQTEDDELGEKLCHSNTVYIRFEEEHSLKYAYAFYVLDSDDFLVPGMKCMKCNEIIREGKRIKDCEWTVYFDRSYVCSPRPEDYLSGETLYWLNGGGR